MRKFFRKRFRFESTEYPTWRSIRRLLPAGVVRVDEAAAASDDEEELEDDEEGVEVPRLDLMVEASGFNRAMQSELESVSRRPGRVGGSSWPRDADRTPSQYMNEVAGLSDPEDLSELSGDDDGESTAGEASGSDTEGEEELVARPRGLDVGAEQDNSSSASEEDSEDASESDDASDGAAPSLVAASAHGGTQRSHATSRSTRTSQAGDLRQTISADLVKQRVRTESKHHARKGVHGAGKAKGHKWKTSAATLVGKNGADGW